jgi:hypothetical protein
LVRAVEWKERVGSRVSAWLCKCVCFDRVRCERDQQTASGWFCEVRAAAHPFVAVPSENNSLSRRAVCAFDFVPYIVRVLLSP